MSDQRPYSATYIATPDARPCPAQVWLLSDGRLWLEPEGMAGWQIASEDCRIVGHALQTELHLRGEARLILAEPEALEGWRRHHGSGRGNQLLSRGQRNVAIVLAIVLGFVAVLWGGYRYGIPAIAEPIAFSIPDIVAEQIGETGLAEMDGSQLTASRLSSSQRQEIEALLDKLEPSLGIELHFRHMGGVANAFALPNGAVIVTDDLVSRLSGQEVQAVLAHEIAHIERRHSLQLIVQTALLPVAISALTGDISWMADAGGAIVLVLANQGYSRDMESDADRYAVRMLKDRDLDPRHLARALERLSEVAGGNAIPSWLSSHPDTVERVEAIEWQSARN